MKLISLQFFVVLFFYAIFPSTARADLTTESYVFLKPEKVDQIISSMVPRNFEINDTEFKLGDFEHLKGMEFNRPSLSLILTLDPNVKSSRDGKLMGSLFLQEGELRLRNFEYKEVRYIDKGVSEAEVNINVSCTELVLNFRNSVGFFEAKPSFSNGKLYFPKDNRKFSFEPNQLHIDLSQCHSPSNAEDLFIETLKEWLDSDNGQFFVENQAFLALSDYMTELLDTKLSGLMLLNTEFSIGVKSLDFVDESWRIGASITIKNEKTLNIKYDEIPSANRFNKSKIVFPRSVLSSFILYLFKSITLPITVERSQIPDADTLFNNYWNKLLGWSDLLKFKKSINFDLNISLFNNRLKYLGQKNGQIYYNLNNNHQIDMNFLKEGQKLPYMQFIGNTQVQVGLKFQDNSIKLKLWKVKANTNADWHPKMTDWRNFKTRSKPVLSRIMPPVLTGLTGSEYNINLKDLLSKKEDLIKDLKLESSKNNLSLSFN